MAIPKKISSLRELPTVRQLRAFMAVYETGSMSAAADLLALTQPAVTLLLKELEAKLGLRLFDRSTRRLQRTDAAAEAYAHAERVLADLGEMTTSLSALATGSRGAIQIACTSALAQTLLPGVMREFTQAWPDVRVGLHDCSPAEFIELIRSRRVTFGIGTLETALPDVEERVVLQDTLVAVAPRSRFANRRAMTWKQLAAHPLVVVRAGYGVRRHIDAAAAEAGVQLDIAHEVSMLATAVALAAAGLGVAIVPSTVLVHTPHAGLVARRLVDPVVPRNTAVVIEKGRSLPAAASAFIALLGQRAVAPWRGAGARACGLRS